MSDVTRQDLDGGAAHARTLAGLASSIPLFASMSGEALDDIAQTADSFSVAAGERLFAQNDPADGVYLVASGTVSLFGRTPGDGHVQLANVGQGGVIGEFCLLDGGRRSAEAVADGPASGFRIDLERFLALRASGRAAAFDLLERLRREVARRTRATIEDIARISGSCAPKHTPSAKASGSPSNPADCEALLRTFPGFDRFDAACWREFAALTNRQDLPRGTLVEQAGAAAGAIHVVARGALRAALPAPSGVSQLLVHGPGALAGVAAAVDGGAWPALLEAREDAVAYALPADAFAAIAAARSPLAARLLDMAGRQMTTDLRRLTRARNRLQVLSTAEAA